MELSELHDCELCHGKIVAITTINGKSCCGYCKQPVDYKQYFHDKLKNDTEYQRFMKKIENEIKS